MQADLLECELAALDSPASEPALLEEPLMAANTKPKSDVKGWIAAISAVTVPIILATWGLAHEFSNLDKHISRVETAVRLVAAKQGGDTKTLIDEALTVAALDSKAGRIDRANAVVAVANRLLDEQKRSLAPAPQQTFDKVLAKYQILARSPALKDSTHQGLLTLAEYRTAVAEPMTNSSILSAGKMETRGPLTIISDTGFFGRGFNNSPEGIDIDGFIMEDVVFENVTIVYRGTLPVSMKNVRFINCRFVVPDTPRGDQLLIAAVQPKANAQIS